MTEKKLRVAVLFGGRSGEHDVSLMSARGVLGAIDKEKYEVVPVAISRTGRWLPPGRAAALLVDGSPAPDGDAGAGGADGAAGPGDRTAAALVADPRNGAMVTFGGADGPAGGEALLQRFDVVFPILHGPFGEDGTVQGFLELANLPYVGAGVLGSALGMDKVKMKEVLRYHGLPVTDWVALRRWQWAEDRAAASWALETPTLDPRLDGLTKQGKPNRAAAASAAARSSAHCQRRRATQSVTGRPW